MVSQPGLTIPIHSVRSNSGCFVTLVRLIEDKRDPSGCRVREWDASLVSPFSEHRQAVLFPTFKVTDRIRAHHLTEAGVVIRERIADIVASKIISPIGDADKYIVTGSDVDEISAPGAREAGLSLCQFPLGFGYPGLDPVLWDTTINNIVIDLARTFGHSDAEFTVLFRNCSTESLHAVMRLAWWSIFDLFVDNTDTPAYRRVVSALSIMNESDE